MRVNASEKIRVNSRVSRASFFDSQKKIDIEVMRLILEGH
jgi:hypothetical protein